jgi:hypothetical protein
MSPLPILHLSTAARMSSAACRAWGIALLALLIAAGPSDATMVTGLYEATVPLAERSERGQAMAIQDAMRQVLVRVTGRRDAGDDPALAALVENARRYVQQFRVVGTNQFFAGFDGARVERAVAAAGQPIWGHERPATLVLLTVGQGSNRALLYASSTSEVRQEVARGAQLRGLPLVWPDASRPVSAAELSAAAPERLRELGTQYGADAVLAGTTAGSGSMIHWTLVQGSETNEWRGSPGEGPQGAADWFARVFSAESAAGEGAVVAIAVSGVTDLRAYAAVTEYLQSLTLVRALSVDEVAGDSVLYRARVQGGSERLARAIGLGTRLAPEAPTGYGDPGSTLSFRYRP